jgi:demethylmenaquinone methyltransferase/2-methoxy-6-polyprenyl-1,4-benzoquinol methylase
MERVAPAPTEVPARTRHARRLFSGIPSHYDALAEVLSFGQNGRWRRTMVGHVRTAVGLMPCGQATVLDVASGPAAVAIELARRVSGARIVGLDQSPQMLGAGVANARDRGFGRRIRFALGQGEHLPFSDVAFDAVTFTYLLRYVDDPAAYTRIALPLLGRLISPPWYEVGRFLGPSISGFYATYPMAEQLAMWRAAGISNVRARTMSLGGGVVIWGTKAASDG